MSYWGRTKIANAALRLSTATALNIATPRSFQKIRFGGTFVPFGRRREGNETRPIRTPLNNRRKLFKPSATLPDIPEGFFPGYTPYRFGTAERRCWGLIPQTPESDHDNPFEDPAPSVPVIKMHSYLQISYTPAADANGACLVLHYNTKRYLFGHVADGTQRVGIERNTHLTKVTDIFLTGPISARNTGGLFGMILTIADVHTSSRNELLAKNKERKATGKKPLPVEDKIPLNIYGGKNLAHMLASGRFFVLRDNFPITPHELLADPRSQNPSLSRPDYTDEFIQVWNVPLFRSSTPTPVSDGDESPRKRRRFDVPEPQEGSSPEADQELRLKVVKAMFDSEWRLDKLWECMLSEVRLPATVFYRDTDGKMQKYEGPFPGQPGFQDIAVFVRRPWPASEIESLPPTTQAHDSMCYIIKEQPRRGRFLPDEAIKLGVPKWKFKDLTNGKTVTLDDGTVVKPEQVVEPGPPQVAFAILDVRDPALLDSLFTRPEWSNQEIMQGLTAIYWILDPSVSSDPRLAQFMRSFDDKVKHIIFGENISQNELVFRRAASHMLNLNSMDPKRFPLPVHSDGQPQLPPGMPENACIARSGEQLQIAPTTEFRESELPTGSADLVVYQRDRRAQKAIEKAEKRVTDPNYIALVEESEKGIPQRDAEIITLGTGSCMPSLNRNVSSTLLRIPGYGTCLLDCGENTLGQMRRTFGYEETDQILRDLRFIYISHLHADHHLGTSTVLQRLGEVQDPKAPPVYIICPYRYASCIREAASLENLGRIEFVTRTYSRHPVPRQRVTWEKSPEWISENLGLTSLSAVFVDHCVDAMAVAITWPSGLKIAYSGDCRPSPQFAQVGLNAHVLIHECTFDDDRRGDAMVKKHSTYSEAVDIAKQMKARRLLLTHFSQRYPKIQGTEQEDELDGKKTGSGSGSESASESDSGPYSDSEGESNAASPRPPITVFAFDQMRIKVGEFRYAAKYLPAIKRLLYLQERSEMIAEAAKGAAGGNNGKGDGGKNKNNNNGQKKENKNKNKQKGGFGKEQ